VVGTLGKRVGDAVEAETCWSEWDVLDSAGWYQLAEASGFVWTAWTNGLERTSANTGAKDVTQKHAVEILSIQIFSVPRRNDSQR